MKKFAFLLILALGSTYVHSQFDVTLYKIRDVVEFNSAYDQITVMEMDPSGNIWFNLYNTWGGGGMGKFTGKDWIVFNMGTDLLERKLGLYVNAFAFDLDNYVWIGTDNGLAQFDGISPTGWNVYNTGNSPIPDTKITAIAVDNQNIKWIGCSNGNLAAFDGSKWIILDKYSGKDMTINDLEKDLEGNIWIARNGTPGLLKLKDMSFTEFPDLSDVKHIEIDQKKGQVYLVSKDKLVILENDKVVEIVQPDPKLNCELYQVAEHQEGPFVSSNKGILQKLGSEFKLYSKYNSALPDLVPPENYNPVPLVYDGFMGLWFSFIYDGIKASYAGIGHMDKMVIAIPQPISLDKPSLRFCFGESITLDANTDAANYVWDGLNTTNRIYTVFDTRTINLDIFYEEECKLEDTIQVQIGERWVDSVICVQSSQTSVNTSIDVLAQHVFEDDSIGVVTCDPVLNKNLVVWQKTADKGTEFYNIYKVLSSDTVYLGSIDYIELTVFTDTTSNPKKVSDRYVITAVDTCGNESFLSSVHKTMHLAASPGTGDQINLIWEHYEGIPFDWYYIYRGTDSTAMELIDSVDYYAGTTQYTDENPPLFKVYYSIGVKLPEPILLSTGKKAGTGPYSQSMSNLEDNRFLTSVNDLKSKEVISYPNPFSQWTQIDFENPMKCPYQLVVTDMSGKIVKMIEYIRDNKVVVLRDNLPQGFYLFELKGEKVYRGKFVIE